MSDLQPTIDYIEEDTIDYIERHHYEDIQRSENDYPKKFRKLEGRLTIQNIIDVDCIEEFISPYNLLLE